MNFDKWKKIFDEIGNTEDLGKNNIIEKIKEKLQVVAPDLYQDWEKNQFDINHIFIITTDQSSSITLKLFHIAVRLDNSKVVDFLIKKGADLNEKDSDDNIPLCLAAKKGNKATLEVLIKNNEHLQLLYNSYKADSMKLLSSQRIVDGANSLHYEKFKILCEYNKLSYENIKELLSNTENIITINDLSDHALKEKLNKGGLEELGIKMVNKSDDELESSDSEEDVDFSDYNSDSEENEDHYNLNYEKMETSSENQNAAVSIPSAEVDNEKSEDQNDCEKMEISSENQNDCNDKIWQFLFDRFSRKEIAELLENQKAVDNITCYTIEELYFMSDVCELSPQNIIKVLEHITAKKLELICNKFDFKDTKTLLENQKVVNNITNYTIEGLQLMFYSYDLSPQDIIKVLEHITFGKYKILCERFDFRGTKTLLENHIVVERLESIDYKKLKFICDKFGSNAHTLLENHIVVEHLESIDYEKLELICNKFDFRRVQALLENQKTADNIINYTIKELKRLFDNSELTLQNIIKVLEDITSEKSKILLSSFGFRDIHQLLKDQMVAKVIDDIAPEKLELICNRLSSNARTLLENQKVVNNITNYTIEELLLVLYTCGLSGKNIIKILEHITSEEFKILCERFDFRDTKTLLENQKVVNNITNYTIEELHSMFNAYDLSNQIITTKGLLLALHNTYGLSDQNIKKVLEHFTLEKLQLIYEKFDVSNAKTLLENQKAVDNITHYTIKELHSMFDHYDLSPQNIITVLEHITSRKFMILYNNFNSGGVKALLENQVVVKHLESISYKKLELICNKFNFEDTKALLENQKAVDNITHYTIKELHSMFDHYDLSPQNIITVLEYITFGKFKILCERFDFRGTKILLENENAVKYIGSVNDQKLEEIIDTIHSVDLVNIFKNFTPDVKSTLRFAIALHRAGKVEKVDINYLNNKERIYEDIIEHLPQKLSIDIKYPFPGIYIGIKDLPTELNIDIKSFVQLGVFKTGIECEEPVSKLYDLSLEQVIKNMYGPRV